MTDFACASGRSGDHFAVGDYSATNAGANRDVDKVFGSDMVAESGFSECCQRCVMSNPNGQTHRFSQSWFHRFVVPAGEIWWVVIGAGGGSDRTCGRHADSDNFSVGRSCGAGSVEEFCQSITGVVDPTFGVSADRSTTDQPTFGVDECCSDVGATNVGGEGVLGICSCHVRDGSTGVWVARFLRREFDG